MSNPTRVKGGPEVSSKAPVEWAPIVVGFLAGVLSRLASLRSDYRQYPSYPAGWVTQFGIAAVAAFIGAAFLPALKGKEYTAATFLTLAATELYQIRGTERKTLTAQEKVSLVNRGSGYIEGIALVFEERNYLVLFTAAVASGLSLFLGTWWGIAGGVVFLGITLWLRSGMTVGSLLEVREGHVHFEKESLLYVDDVMLMEVGLKESREKWVSQGRGLVFIPKPHKSQSVTVLWDYGQRQAITHDVSVIAGVQLDVGYSDLQPLCRMKMPQGENKAALGIIPVVGDVQELIRAARVVPILESAKGHPLRGHEEHGPV